MKSEKGKTEKKDTVEAKTIVMMASRRRVMKELDRVTFCPDTTSNGGLPGSLLGVSLREKRNNFNKMTERTRSEKK